MIFGLVWVMVSGPVMGMFLGGLKVLVVVFRLSGRWCRGRGSWGLYVYNSHMKYNYKVLKCLFVYL